VESSALDGGGASGWAGVPCAEGLELRGGSGETERLAVMRSESFGGEISDLGRGGKSSYRWGWVGTLDSLRER
jgi:hypothetical protein